MPRTNDIPRRQIVTFAIGYREHLDMTVESMRKYASEVGADFCEMKFFPEMDGTYNGNPCYSCVEWLKFFARQEYYDEVLMLDDDVLIAPGSPNIFEKVGDMACVTDAAWRRKDTRYRCWLRRNFPAHVSTTDDNAPYFNAGVLLFRKQAATRMDLEGPYPDDFANDQDFLNMRSEEAGLDINWLGDDYNWRDVDNRRETARAHFLHFVGGQKHNIKYWFDFFYR